MADNQPPTTPMMKQYSQIKARYPDTILFFRLGDFYEMFQDDAKIGSQILNITLTSRDKGQDGKIPMCGVPYHAAESYITKLVKAGHKVAICEQVTKPTKGISIVEREVVRVVTPSSVFADAAYEGTSELLLTFSMTKSAIGFAGISMQSGDVSITNEFISPQNDPATIVEEYVSRYRPAEVLLPRAWYEDAEILARFKNQGVNVFSYDTAQVTKERAVETIMEYYKVTSLEAFGIENLPEIIVALGIALRYISETQKQKTSFLRYPAFIISDEFMKLSGQTITNLEIFSTKRTGGADASLFSAMDETKTVMGRRLLSAWITQPLLSHERINKRLDAVAFFVGNQSLRESLRTVLQEVSDIERSLTRLSVGIGTARDAYSIGQTLHSARTIRDLVEKSNPTQGLLDDIVTATYWGELENLQKDLAKSLADDPPAVISDGGMIRDGYNLRLDELRKIRLGGTDTLKNIEERERARTKIASLKVRFNKVFGYYIEVSTSNIDKIPEDYIRRQTLVNAERYIIPELKEYENTVLNAESEIIALEQELFSEIVQNIFVHSRELQQLASDLSTVDILCGFAESAVTYSYSRPSFVEVDELIIREGRHPVVERMSQKRFVPNGIELSTVKDRMMLLTGANMAGKSTYIRQIALLVIMSQMGSFVPAEFMSLSVIDYIHTRIGAMDNVSQGLSTFMVEMVETAFILHNLTDRSLIILDEVGRGTSTQDGLAIAWAITEFLHTSTKAKVLFATHYLELATLADKLDHMGSYHMAIAEKGDDVIFLYQVKEGEATRSYGVQVARHAGVPREIITRAEELYADIHARSQLIIPKDSVQPSLFEVPLA